MGKQVGKSARGGVVFFFFLSSLFVLRVGCHCGGCVGGGGVVARREGGYEWDGWMAYFNGVFFLGCRFGSTWARQGPCLRMFGILERMDGDLRIDFPGRLNTRHDWGYIYIVAFTGHQ